MSNSTVLKKRAIFQSDLEIKNFIQKYCDEHKQIFVIFRSQSLASVNLKNKFKINKECTNYYIEYGCKYGEKKIASTATIKKSSTFKRGCKAFIKFKIDQTAGCYIISDYNEKHSNHAGLEEFYDHLPEKRRLNEEEKVFAKNLMSLACKPARLQIELKKVTKKEVRRKDLLNIAASLRPKDEDDINDIVQMLQSDYGANAEVLHDNKVLTALYFSTVKMKDYLKQFGQIVFVDCTYKIFKANYSLMLFVIEDGDGRSQVVGIGILANETKPVIQWLIETFKQDHKESSKIIKGFMTDKDMTERDVIKQIFPNAALFICQFHVLRTFSREICSSKMPINMKEREISLQYIDNMVKSSDEQEYADHYEQFIKNCPDVVISYFNKNWHPIKNEWVKYSIFKCNYGNLTNNRIESVNSKLKDFLRKYNSIKSFIKDYFCWQNHRNTEMKYSDIQKKIKTNVQSWTEDDVAECKKNYASILTNFALDKVCEQLDLFNYVTLRKDSNDSYLVRQNNKQISVTSSHCTCLDQWSMSLPCRHIFAVRKLLNMDLYSEELCDKRWKILNSTALQIQDSNRKPKKTYTIHKIKNHTKCSIGNRRKKIKIITDELISLSTERAERKFLYCLDLLRNLRDLWKQNKEVKLMVYNSKEKKFIDLPNNNDQNLNLLMQRLDVSDISNDCSVVDTNISAAEIKTPKSTKIIGKVSGALQTTVKRKTKKKK